MDTSRKLSAKEIIILCTPFLVVAAGAVVIRLFEPFLGVWAWLPWILSYWMIIGLLAVWGGGRDALRKWVGRPSGHWGWSVLAVALGLGGITMFLENWQSLLPWLVSIPWLLIGLINPFLEEFYWRGLLLDAARKISGWIAVPVITLFFSLNHLLGPGYTSSGCAHPFLLVNTFVVGVVYSLIYKKTGSLRWAIVGHALADLLGLSVPVFLNLWVPPSI